MSSLLYFVIPRPQKVVPWLLGLITLKSSLSACAVFLSSSLAYVNQQKVPVSSEVYHCQHLC